LLFACVRAQEGRKAAEEAVLVGPVLPAGEGAHAPLWV
jgi:hypothetical protein